MEACKINDIALTRITDILSALGVHHRVRGAEIEMLNPRRDDRRFGSFKINKNSGAWCEFATNESGRGAISLVQYLTGDTKGSAAQTVTGILGITDKKPRRAQRSRAAQAQHTAPAHDQEKWQCVMPIPSAAPPRPSAHPELGKPSHVWTYRDSQGDPLCLVYRFDRGGDEKTYRPLTYWSNGRTGAWRWTPPEAPRPLYGLDRLVANAHGIMFVTEGEKAADAINALGGCAVSSMGGSAAANYADWHALQDRDVMIWPDADDPGRKYAQDVAHQLQGIARSIFVIDPTSIRVNPPPGWDAADAAEEGFTLSHLFSARMESVSTAAPKSAPRQNNGANKLPFWQNTGNCSAANDDAADELPNGSTADNPLIIDIAPGNMSIHNISERAQKRLGKAGLCWNYGGRVVTIERDHTGAVYAFSPTQPVLTGIIEEVSEWYNGKKRMRPPERYVNAILDAPHHLPYLLGIARQPFLHDDDFVIKNGYHVPSKLYADLIEDDYRALAEDVTRDDALQALANIRQLLREFPFASKRDESAALAAILTAAIRISLPTAPLCLIVSPTPGTGKSYLAKVIAAFSGTSPEISTLPSSNTEFEKTVLSCLLVAPSAIIFDNLINDIKPYPALNTIITETHWTARVLGESRRVNVSTRTMIIANGNNIKPLRDLARRTLSISLDAKMENPVFRSFHSDPVREILGKRSFWVSQALTIIKAFIKHGQNDQRKPAFAGFSDWDRLCRAPLLWLGMPDPAALIVEGMASDPGVEALKSVIYHWHRAFGDKPRKVRDALITAQKDDQLLEALAEVSGSSPAGIDRNRLGRWLLRHENRVVNGLRLVKIPGGTGPCLWRVVPITSDQQQDAGTAPVTAAPSAGAAVTATHAPIQGTAPMSSSTPDRSDLPPRHKITAAEIEELRQLWLVMYPTSTHETCERFIQEKLAEPGGAEDLYELLTEWQARCAEDDRLTCSTG